MSWQVTSSSRDDHLYLQNGEGSQKKEIDLGTKSNQAAANAFEIKVGTEIVYVNKDSFYKGLASALHESCPNLDYDKCIASVKEVNREQIEKWLEEKIAQEKTRELPKRFEEAKIAFQHHQTEETQGELFNLAVEARDLRSTIKNPPPLLQAIEEDSVNLARRTTIRNSMVKSAKEKGRAYRSAIDSLSNTMETSKVISEAAKSEQKVFLTNDAVFKQSSERAWSEENQIDGLSSILLPGSVVPQTKMKSIISSRYGFTSSDVLSRADRERQIQLDKVPHTNLDQDSIKEINTVNSMRNTYTQCLDEEHSIDLPTLFKGLDQGTYNKSTVVDGLSLHDHYLTGTPVGISLSCHLNGLDREDFKFEIVPAFSNKEEEMAYSKCEASKWEYQDPQTKEWKEVSFNKLHELSITGEIKESEIRKKGEETVAENKDLQQALSCKMRYVPPMLMRDDSGRLLPLTNPLTTVAKPMIHNMLILDNMETNPGFCQLVLNNLSPEAEAKAIFTLDAQFMDLHGGNLGFAPLIPEEYRDAKFSYYTDEGALIENVPFNHMVQDYYENNLDLSQSVQVNGEPLPKAEELLKCKWDLILFDTDISLGENNQVITFQGMHYIPLKSELLQTKWKHKELSPEAMSLIQEMDKQTSQALAWMANEDSPLYQKIRGDTELVALVHEEQSHYNFGDEIGKNGKSIEDLSDQFSKDLSVNSDHPIWKKLDPEQKLSVDEKFKMAKQLFPRATINQQRAFRERISKRQELIKNHEAWKTVNPEEKSQIKSMLSSLPLTTFEKEAYHAIFTNLWEDVEVDDRYQSLFTELSESIYPASDTESLKKGFIDLMNQKTKPTYFNMAKSMYPFLADAQFLGDIVHKKEGGKNIGKKCIEEDTYYLLETPQNSPIQSALTHFERVVELPRRDE